MWGVGFYVSFAADRLLQGTEGSLMIVSDRLPTLAGEIQLKAAPSKDGNQYFCAGARSVERLRKLAQ